MTKTLKVSEDTYWKLKAAAVEKRVGMAALIESMVDAVESPAPEKIPAQGWREPAAGTAPETRPAKPPPPRPVLKENGGSVVPPAQMRPEALKRSAKDDEQAKVERMKAAIAAMPEKVPINPKDVHAGSSATSAARKQHPAKSDDETDVPF